MPENKDEAPKIFIDSDWKEEARKEKEELDRQTREAQAQAEMPPASILDIVQMVVMQASVSLGGFQDPQTGQRIPPSLLAARHYIDLLALLIEKTRDRVTEEEKKIMEGTLHQLRLAFVEIAGAGAGAPDAAPGGADRHA